MTYEVIIKILDSIEYKGLFSLHNNKIYIRSMIDNDEYEDMFKQLIDDGYVKIQKNENDYNVDLINFHNNLIDIFSKVREIGIDISYEELVNSDYTFSLVADGDDLTPEVIAHLSKGTKIISLSENIFKYANNADYEPKINIRASSYAIDIQEINNDDDKLKEFIISINNQEVDISKYLVDTSYSNTIKSLFDVAGIETLKTLKIILKDSTELILDINAIKNVKKNFKTKLLDADFKEENINTKDNLRAFDDKKHRLLLDISPTYHLHFDDIEMYKLLKTYYDQNKNITIEGNYKSKQTINVVKITVLT